ncbi:hypothetical protein NLG97_g9794 [Lecanicillium saksenae]|uniref:Uncharacterized protein n=1 Tax=Lecanicillium saksenae TaxID=468837 RepID=A0ACC1QFI8_9HYPO|nr:hypothetical protein NLG97_g9794 [Lecanicillium saksenae]
MPAEQDSPAAVQPAGTTNHSANVNASRLLLLPLELRRIIILDVLHHGHQGAPILSEEVVGNRIRLWNGFDPEYPAGTSIYVPKIRPWTHGEGLLRTSRQLRRDTLDLIEDTLKTGKVHIPFELDVMVIKGAGVLPTWTSFPYHPRHIKNLKITFRVFQHLGWIIPTSWADEARFDDRHSLSVPTVTEWNFLVVIALYALGRLGRPSKASARDAAASERGPPGTRQHTTRSNRFAGPGVHAPSSARYTVDSMLLSVHRPEYWDDGTTVLLDPQLCRGGIDIQYDSFQFRRQIFNDDLLRPGRLPEPVLQMVDPASTGPRGGSQLLAALWKLFAGFVEDLNGVYLDSMARNVRTVTIASEGSGHRAWEGILTGGFESTDVDALFSWEMSQTEPHRAALDTLRVINNRRELGWWDHALHKTILEERRQNY